MYANKRKLVLGQLGLWLCLCLCLCQELCWAQNASTVVWEPSTASGNANKREVGNRLDYAGTNIAKSYDPPPEFYRGPGTTSSGSSTASHSASSLLGSTGVGSGSQLGNVGESLSEAYNKWRQSTGQHERISVGHFGGGAGAGLGAHIQSPHGHASYAYEGHPYEYVGGAGHGGYYGGSSSAEAGIPFDVYGTRPGPGHGSHHLHHYPSTGGEYAYLEAHDIASHKGPAELSQKALLAKSFLIPLASAAVLGIAAALVSNPLLLQLGTVSGVGGGFAPVVGKRKRRALRRAYSAHI
ncbi:uncharacterized protein [Drosophila virilis]|uniref:Uncharacterized protein n=1 Tax=Drosophila virilis TaxID=7244 RepID=B4M8V4_DROVI|nr:uncharacterized protein LOC6634306 [Drosophila virilis]EDW57630.1 uncharacterized protein Dvir_GJ18033 [Drosophila virilis]